MTAQALKQLPVADVVVISCHHHNCVIMSKLFLQYLQQSKQRQEQQLPFSSQGREDGRETGEGQAASKGSADVLLWCPWWRRLYSA